MANIYSTTSDYWIKPGALTISLNALDNPQYLQSSVLSGAVIMAFKQGVIEYDSSHNYRKWNLTAENTFFHNNEAKYVYARLDRKEDKTQALIVYSSEKLDIVGRTVAEEDVEEDSLYFYIYLGSITASVNNDGNSIPRVWDDSFNFGTLATDQYNREESSPELNKMFRLNEITGMIDVLKTISEATINIVRIGKNLIFGKKEITDIKRSDDSDEDVPVGDDNLTTSKYVEEDINRKALRKDQSDRTDHSLEVGKDLTVEGILHLISQMLIGENGSGISVLPDGKSQAVVDYLYVKVKAIFDELEVKKKTYVGGEQILSPAGMKCIRVEELTEVYRCYFKAEEDGVEVENQFTPGTLAIAQECNIKAGVSHNVGNRYYWRKVTAVGADYIDLSKTKCDPNIENDIPTAGDDIVALGHSSDITRQGVIVLSSVNEVAPSILMYQGINDFTLVGKEVIGFDFDKATGKARMRVYGDAYIGAKDESSYIKYTDEEGVDVKGRFHIKQGSTGWKNMDGLPDEIQAAADLAQKAQDAIDGAAVGSVNLLRNSGFVGNYQSEELSAETQLSADAELYSKSLKYWAGMATVQDDNDAVSGKSVVIGSLSQPMSLINQEVYVISYQAKGTSLAVSCGNYNVTQALTSEYQRYTHKLTFNGSGIFMLSGTATVCDVQLERGTIATDWKPSPLDNDRTLAEFRSIQYLADAIKNGSVDMIGGLVLANILMLGNYKDGVMQKVTAGISGIYNDDDDVYTWGGGTFEQAIKAVMMFKDNPRYQPTDNELKDIAKAVFTHGGRAILNDVVLRGYIYALGGEFRGKVTIADGKIILNEDGSGRLANGNIEWDADGNPTIRGRYESKIAGYRVVIDPGADENSFPHIVFYDRNNKGVISMIAELGYDGTVYPKIEFRDPTNEFRHSSYRIDGMTVNEKIDGANYQTFIGAGNIYIAKNSTIEWQIKKY